MLRDMEKNEIFMGCNFRYFDTVHRVIKDMLETRVETDVCVSFLHDSPIINLMFWNYAAYVFVFLILSVATVI